MKCPHKWKSFGLYLEYNWNDYYKIFSYDIYESFVCEICKSRKKEKFTHNYIRPAEKEAISHYLTKIYQSFSGFLFSKEQIEAAISSYLLGGYKDELV